MLLAVLTANELLSFSQNYASKKGID